MQKSGEHGIDQNDRSRDRIVDKGTLQILSFIAIAHHAHAVRTGANAHITGYRWDGIRRAIDPRVKL